MSLPATHSSGQRLIVQKLRSGTSSGHPEFRPPISRIAWIEDRRRRMGRRRRIPIEVLAKASPPLPPGVLPATLSAWRAAVMISIAAHDMPAANYPRSMVVFSVLQVSCAFISRVTLLPVRAAIAPSRPGLFTRSPVGGDLPRDALAQVVRQV